MIAFGVVFHQFWARNLIEANETFHIPLNVLKQTFCAPCKVSDCGKIVHVVLSTHKLDLQTFFSKWPWFISMRESSMRIMNFKPSH
jgi:hypothetical protein